MSSRAESVPRDHELLCEHCGYGIDGLPTVGNCPECGNPLADSTTTDGRGLPPWELPGLAAPVRLMRTVVGVVLRPKRFFRSMLARESPGKSLAFAMVMYWVSAYFFALAVAMHLLFVHGGRWDLTSSLFIGLLGGTALTPFVFALIWATSWLVARLSALEARYHGMRLPAGTVTRALHYLSADLVPVSVVAVLLVANYRALLATEAVPRSSTELPYLYGLCGYVVISAGYLFWAYWMAMRNLMYANR